MLVLLCRVLGIVDSLARGARSAAAGLKQVTCTFLISDFVEEREVYDAGIRIDDCLPVGPINFPIM